MNIISKNLLKKSTKKSAKRSTKKSAKRSTKKSTNKSVSNNTQEKKNVIKNVKKNVKLNNKKRTTKRKQNKLNKNLDKLRDNLLKIRKQNQPHFGKTYVQNMSNTDFNGINISDTNSRLNGIVMYYAPWCPHCHSMVPVLNEVADKVYENSNMSDVVIGSVDCTLDDNQVLNNNMNIMGYPTLKLYKNGEYLEDYSGPRDANALLLTIEKLR